MVFDICCILAWELTEMKDDFDMVQYPLAVTSVFVKINIRVKIFNWKKLPKQKLII